MTGKNVAFNRAASDRLDNILNRLSAIPEGREFVDFLKANDIAVKIEKDTVAYAAGKVSIREIENKSYIYGDCSIHLNEDLNDDNLLQALIHETQHMRQHLSGLGNPDFWPSDEDHCLLRRVQEADAQATTTRITYLLKSSGDTGPWHEIKKTIFAPMADAFETACQSAPHALHDGRAQRAAFDAWFKNDATLRFYDRDTVQNQVTFLRSCLWNSPNHTIRSGKLTTKWLERIGGLSQTNYMNLPDQPPVTKEKYRRNICKNISIAPAPMRPRNDPKPS